MRTEPLDTIDYKGYIIEIYPDYDPESPREGDNICEFHCSHRDYNLGDKGFNYKSGDECIEAVEERERNGDIVLPLYLYDHSGITISLSNSHYPFNDRWDSSQVGFVVIPRLKMLQEFSKKIFTKKLKERALEIAKAEVETFDQYLRGNNVYGYVIKKDEEEELDYRWGYYEQEDAIAEAKGLVDYYVKEDAKTSVKN